MQNTYSPGAVAKKEGNPLNTSNAHEVVLVVKMNGGEALILKEPLKLTFYKFGDDTIIGTDGTFYTFYQYDWASWSHDAFGGRKFTLTMHDGEIVECAGRWWDAKSPTAKILVDQPLVRASVNDLSRLQDCYVYHGYSADAEKWQQLRSTYTGPVYEYHDGELVIKSWLKQHCKLKALIKDYGGGRCAIDENNDVYDMKIIEGKLYFIYRFEVGWHGLYKEYLTEGKKDFSVKESRKKEPTGTCSICSAIAYTRGYGDNPVCHKCEANEERESQNSYRYY